MLFGVHAEAAVVHGTVIKMPGGKYFPDSTVNKTTNDKLISISPLTHITLAREGDQIVCHFPQGKSLNVMPAKLFRGWQWMSLTPERAPIWQTLSKPSGDALKPAP